MTALATLLERVKQRRPFLKQVLASYGDYSLEEYAATFEHKQTETIDNPLDFVECASSGNRHLLGEEGVERLKKRLIRSRALFTGHHHGVDYQPMGIQASILSGLAEEPQSIIPIFGCTNVPLDNSDKAIGILVDFKTRVNLYSNKQARQLVAATGPMTPAMVENARKSIPKVIQKENVRNKLGELLTAYEATFEQTCFVDQAALLNAHIWRELFQQQIGTTWPALASLPFERTVQKVLERDLANPQSLLYAILFDATLRTPLMENLKDVPGCWNNELLQEAWKDHSEQKMQAGKSAFFWGIDTEKRASRYVLIEDHLQEMTPQGKKIPWTPEHVLEKLREGALLPSLFISFATLAFARGFCCYGGFMQTDYLTRMKQSLIAALQGKEAWVRCLENVPTANFAFGPIFLMTKDPELRPAGTIDLLLSGGISSEQLQAIRNIRLREATLSGIIDIYRVIYGNTAELEGPLLEQAKKELNEHLVEHMVCL